MSEQTQEQAVRCPCCGSGNFFHIPEPAGNPWRHCNECDCRWDQKKRRPSPPQAFDPVEALAEIHRMLKPGRPLHTPEMNYHCIVDHLSAEIDLPFDVAPSPPAPDIAQIRARFEAWWSEHPSVDGVAYQTAWEGYCAALGITP